MNVCFLITKIQFSGAQNVFNCVTTELRNRGHRVTILATDELATINAEDENVFGLKENCGRVKKQIQIVKKIRFFVKKNKYDCIIAFGFNSNIKALFSTIGLNIPVIICERMDPRHAPQKKQYILRLERWLLYRRAQGYIFQTNNIKSFFNHRIQEKAFIIPNPVRETVTEGVFDKNRAKTIVTVTRLDEKQKNLLFLLNAFSVFHKSHPDYTLVIIGNGPDQSMYEEEIKKLGATDSIRLLGYHEKPSKYIAGCDIFTLVSYHEGMPNALIEAMALGLPCVVENFGGGAAEELIHTGINGIVLPNYSENEWVNCIEKLVDNETEKNKLGENAFAINQTHSVKNIVDKWEKAISEVSREYYSKNNGTR